MSDLPEQIREIAAEAVWWCAYWCAGWTGDDDPGDPGPQRRVRVTGRTSRHVDLLVEGAPSTGEPDREFRIMPLVFELAAAGDVARTLHEHGERIRQNLAEAEEALARGEPMVTLDQLTDEPP